jgi:hypothetical protein
MVLSESGLHSRRGNNRADQDSQQATIAGDSDMKVWEEVVMPLVDKFIEDYQTVN